MKKRNGIVNAFSVLIGVAAGCVAYYTHTSYKRSEDKVNRLDSYYRTMQGWIKCKQKDFSLKDYFDNLGAKNIAIYGMGALGELFYNEMKMENIRVTAFVDKNAEALVEGLEGLPVVSLEDIGEYNIDTMIVTPVFAFDEVAELVKDEEVKLISLDELYS